MFCFFSSRLACASQSELEKIVAESMELWRSLILDQTRSPIMKDDAVVRLRRVLRRPEPSGPGWGYEKNNDNDEDVPFRAGVEMHRVDEKRKILFEINDPDTDGVFGTGDEKKIRWEWAMSLSSFGSVEIFLRGN